MANTNAAKRMPKTTSHLGLMKLDKVHDDNNSQH